MATKTVEDGIRAYLDSLGKPNKPVEGRSGETDIQIPKPFCDSLEVMRQIPYGQPNGSCRTRRA